MLTGFERLKLPTLILKERGLAKQTEEQEASSPENPRVMSRGAKCMPSQVTSSLPVPIYLPAEEEKLCIISSKFRVEVSLIVQLLQSLSFLSCCSQIFTEETSLPKRGHHLLVLQGPLITLSFSSDKV